MMMWKFSKNGEGAVGSIRIYQDDLVRGAGRTAGLLLITIEVNNDAPLSTTNRKMDANEYLMSVF